MGQESPKEMLLVKSKSLDMDREDQVNKKKQDSDYAQITWVNYTASTKSDFFLHGGCIDRTQEGTVVHRSGGIHRPQFTPVNCVVQLMVLA